MLVHASGADREQLYPDIFRDVGTFDLEPQLVEVEKPLGDQKRDNHLAERGAFLLRHVEREGGTETVHHAVRDPRRDDVVAKPMAADRGGMSGPHRLGECGEQVRLQHLFA